MACTDSSITLTTDCSLAANPTECDTCKTFLYGSKCQGVSFNTICKDDNTNTSRPAGLSSVDCYACQNRMYQAQILEGDLDNAMAKSGDYIDSTNRYGNEITKTFYIVVGIIGLLTCSYYIR
jgi:hypothetical protein